MACAEVLRLSRKTLSTRSLALYALLVFWSTFGELVYEKSDADKDKDLCHPSATIDILMQKESCGDSVGDEG